MIEKEELESQIEDIVFDNMNHIYYEIQTLIGTDDGGFAGMYHQDKGEKAQEELVKYFKKYAEAERQFNLPEPVETFHHI